MRALRMKMLIIHKLPIIIALIRVVFTILTLVWNPLYMRFRFFQLIPLLVLLANIFRYVKLYSDSDPIAILLIPTILHFIVVLAIKRELSIIPFIPILVVDIIYLVAKGFKASLYPFEIDDGVDLEEEALLADADSY